MATLSVQPPLGNTAGSSADDAIFSKIHWHLLPLLIVAYMVAFIDRINIGFAQLQMKQTLPFSDEAYAIGAGVFFIGYFLFEVPSNLILERSGARKTLLRIMFCWGIVAAGMMFVQTTTQFYVLRFLLGVFEAGFFPGVILYLTYWYPSARRANVIAVFMTATAVAYVVAGPLSGWIMKYMNGVNGWHGWQWLFLVQGLPASILGIVAYLYLKDRPEDAPWLTPAEKATLRDRLDHDGKTVASASHGSLWGMLRDPKVYSLAIVYFLQLAASYTMLFWSPTLVKSWGIQDLVLVGILSGAVPGLFGAVGMVFIGRSSDKHRERRLHYAFCTVLCAAGLLVTIFAQGSVVGSILGLCIWAIGNSAATPMLFTGISEYVPKETAAGGIALISSLGNLGPAVMPAITTRINTVTGSPMVSMYLVIALYVVTGTILYFVLRPTQSGVSAAHGLSVG